MPQIACPKCGSGLDLAVGQQSASCPRCGHSFDSIRVQPAPATLDATPGSGAVGLGPDPAGEALLSDLREALGFGPSNAAGHWPSSGLAGWLPGSTDFARGSRLGDFEIIEELGRGGMGVVYRARQLSLGREVALKVLPGRGQHAPHAVARFKAEARAAARLHHTNIVAIYAQGEHDGQFYYAMELIEGAGLDEVVRGATELLSASHSRTWVSTDRATGRAPVQPPEESRPAPAIPAARADLEHLATLMAEVADALACAHSAGVIHRDVKPHNLLMGRDRRIHVTDFGLARLTSEPHLTVSGEVMGTPAYLSPEQISGRVGQINHRTDIYSLGVTLYELMTGRRPFDGETREQIISGITGLEPIPPRRLNPRIPADLETICLRMIEKDPARRHPSAAVLADDLRRFATGRPILSRRTSRARKVAKWVRRHKAASAAMAATVVMVVLAVGLTLSVRQGRLREAGRLLGEAYEQLAYFDYHTPDLDESHIGPAEAWGGDADEIDVCRALLDMGAARWPSAINRLKTVTARRLDDQRAWTILAWAAQEAGDQGTMDAALNAAEGLGSPATADVWFFRGLALHRKCPEEAIECYRRAGAVRAAQRTFYPQAVLHLARARNQQLYATRSLGSLDESLRNLEQLVEHGHYGAYPHYLLSIAHRLAGEVYRGSPSTPRDLADEHFAAALEWARRGQELDPNNDRPIVAEAECLESLEQYDEAIAARTRAIAVALTSIGRWESYHYRWRLYYWIGDLDAALDDLTNLQGFDPESRFYKHVYPMLVLAEKGDMSAALEHARAVADDQPDSAQAVLWSATCLRLLGRVDEAARLLDENADAVSFDAGLVSPQSAEWVRALYAMSRVGVPAESLDELAATSESPRRLWGEAEFHAAAARLAAGDREAALDGFTLAYRSFDSEQRYTYHAKLIAVQMRNNLDWPPWIAVSW